MSTIDDLFNGAVASGIHIAEWRSVLVATWAWLERTIVPKTLAIPTSVRAGDDSILFVWNGSGMTLAVEAYTHDAISWRVSSEELVLYEETWIPRNEVSADSIRYFFDVLAASDSIPGPSPRVLDLIRKGHIADLGWIDAFGSKYGLSAQAKRELIASVMRAINSAASAVDATNKPAFDF